EVLDRQGFLRHLAHRVRAERAHRVALGDGRLVWIDEPVLFARAGNVNDWIEARLADRFEDVELGDDVVGQRGRRRGPAGWHEALRGEMEDAIGLDRAYHAAHRAGVLQLAVDDRRLTRLDHVRQAGLVRDPLTLVEHVQETLTSQVLQVVKLAPP